MLRELKIENLAIIDELDLEFEDGFIVLIWRDRSWKINYTKWNKSTYRRESHY